MKFQFIILNLKYGKLPVFWFFLNFEELKLHTSSHVSITAILDSRSTQLYYIIALSSAVGKRLRQDRSRQPTSESKQLLSALFFSGTSVISWQEPTKISDGRRRYFRGESRLPAKNGKTPLFCRVKSACQPTGVQARSLSGPRLWAPFDCLKKTQLTYVFKAWILRVDANLTCCAKSCAELTKINSLHTSKILTHNLISNCRTI
jgi:hypothetical protein